MSDMLPILTGLVVISAIAFVASNDKKDDKEHKEPKEKKENKPKEKKDDDNLKKLFGFVNKKKSSKKPRRWNKIVDSKGRTRKDKEGNRLGILKPISSK